MLDDLRVRPVQRRGRLFFEVGLPDVRGHADDLAPDVLHGPGRRAARHRGALREAHTLPEGILVGEVPPRQALADDDDRSRSPGVPLGKRAPLDQRDSHRAEVILADQDVSGLRLLARRGAPAIDRKSLPTRPVERGPRRHGGKQHARILAGPIQRRSPVGHRLRKGSASVGDGLEQVVGIDATGDRLQVQEAADHQAGADKKHERDRQLRDDQQAAGPAAAGPAGRGRNFQAIAEIDLRGMQSGHQPEHDSGDERDEQADREDAPVYRHRHPLRNVTAGDREGQQRVSRPARQQHAQRAAQEEQQHALDEHLPDEARPARPERRL